MASRKAPKPTSTPPAAAQHAGPHDGHHRPGHHAAPAADPARPYAGLEGRRTKALSEEDAAGLLAGRGMGLALAAELNGYPGPLHVLEHGASPDPRVRRWQARLDPVERAVAGGCHLTRDPVALVRAAGLEVGPVTQRYLPGPAVSRPWTYGYRFVARRP